MLMDIRTEGKWGHTFTQLSQNSRKSMLHLLIAHFTKLYWIPMYQEWDTFPISAIAIYPCKFFRGHSHAFNGYNLILQHLGTSVVYIFTTGLIKTFSTSGAPDRVVCRLLPLSIRSSNSYLTWLCGLSLNQNSHNLLISARAKYTALELVKFSHELTIMDIGGL